MCVSFLLIFFKLSSGCLLSPHHVNQGGVQKATPQVTLYESHTAEESLRRCRSDRNSQVLPGHPGQARELLHVLLPPHERVCVKGHLLHSRVGIQLGLHTVDIDIHACSCIINLVNIMSRFSLVAPVKSLSPLATVRLSASRRVPVMLCLGILLI